MTQSTCPSCGATLSAGGPAGLCPRCLLKRGMESNTGGFTAPEGRGDAEFPGDGEIGQAVGRPENKAGPQGNFLRRAPAGFQMFQPGTLILVTFNRSCRVVCHVQQDNIAARIC